MADGIKVGRSVYSKWLLGLQGDRTGCCTSGRGISPSFDAPGSGFKPWNPEPAPEIPALEGVSSPTGAEAGGPGPSAG